MKKRKVPTTNNNVQNVQPFEKPRSNYSQLSAYDVNKADDAT